MLGDGEDPLAGRAAGGAGGPDGVTSVTRSRRGGKAPSIMVAVSGGTGVGYVSGRTEGNNVVETCCLGSSLVVINPEVGYHVSPQLVLGVAFRLGLPIGANIEGHSTMAPSVFLRGRYALSRSGEGLRMMGEIGGGVLRNTLKLSDMDRDGYGYCRAGAAVDWRGGWV